MALNHFDEAPKCFTMKKLNRILTLCIPSVLFASQAFAAAAPKKEWTLLVFLNGNNNLDSFGYGDINEMEREGSDENINVVVQWASMKKPRVDRLLVQKDSKPTQITSPIVQSLGAVDMGDYKQLVEFVRWGIENYPAEKYFLDVWNHGGGWHKNQLGLRSNLFIQDISWDDKTGNSISTEELGVALNDAAALMGHKVDIYGSDACLMSMAEVAGEMSEAVSIFVGSQEVEPGDGWEYGDFLSAWKALGAGSSAASVASGLVKTYLASYSGGSQGTQDVTLSAFDLSKTALLEQSVKALGDSVRAASVQDRARILQVAKASQAFEFSDYVDFGDFVKGLKGRLDLIDPTVADAADSAIASYVVANGTSKGYKRAQGVSVWMPTSKFTYQAHSQRYRGMQFSQRSEWVAVLASMLGL